MYLIFFVREPTRRCFSSVQNWHLLIFQTVSIGAGSSDLLMFGHVNF